MKYKYQIELTAIPKCPPKAVGSIEMEAFRFVFSKDLSNSFIPPAIRKPTRIFSSEVAKCSALALSFFVSIELAQKKFRELISLNEGIADEIGDSLASIKVTKTDGMGTSPSSKGHFDLHEFEDNQLLNSAKIIGRLYDKATKEKQSL